MSEVHVVRASSRSDKTDLFAIVEDFHVGKAGVDAAEECSSKAPVTAVVFLLSFERLTSQFDDTFNGSRIGAAAVTGTVIALLLNLTKNNTLLVNELELGLRNFPAEADLDLITLLEVQETLWLFVFLLPSSLSLRSGCSINFLHFDLMHGLCWSTAWHHHLHLLLIWVLLTSIWVHLMLLYGGTLAVKS